MAVIAWDEYAARQRSLRWFLITSTPVVVGTGAVSAWLRVPWVAGSVFFVWVVSLLLVLARYAECECPRCRGPLCSRRPGRLFRRGCGHCGLPLTREAFEAASRTTDPALQQMAGGG